MKKTFMFLGIAIMLAATLLIITLPRSNKPIVNICGGLARTGHAEPYQEVGKWRAGDYIAAMDNGSVQFYVHPGEDYTVVADITGAYRVGEKIQIRSNSGYDYGWVVEWKGTWCP